MPRSEARGVRALLTALACTATSAVLYGMAFPPLSWKPLAWVCLAPFFVAIRRVGLGAGLLLALVWTELASFIVADALPAAVSTYFLQPPAVGLAFAVGIWAFTGALYYMAFVPVYRALALRYATTLPLLAAAAWAVLELARGRLLTGSSVFVGNPWALIGYSQVGFAPLMQIASVTGIYGVGFVLAASNAALALLWESRGRGPRAQRAAVVGLASAAALALLVLGFGVMELREAQDAQARTPAIPVAIVQGHVDLGSVWRSDYYGRNLDVYLGLTVQAIEKGRPAIVFWPETALTFLLAEEPDFQRAIARVLAAGRTQLVAGGPTADESEPPIYHNSVFLLSEKGELRGRYDKQHLLPFTEYFPLPQLDFLRRRFERVRVFAHGEQIAPLETRAGPAAIAVCNEAMLPEVVGDRVRAGASFIANPSNDSWIGERKWADRMFDLVSVRAIEQRRYLVRASTAGPSGIVDPWGRTQSRTEPFSRAVIVGSIRPRSDLSVYGRVGDLFGLLCAASVAVALALGAWRGGTVRRSQTSPTEARLRA